MRLINVSHFGSDPVFLDPELALASEASHSIPISIALARDLNDSRHIQPQAPGLLLPHYCYIWSQYLLLEDRTRRAQRYRALGGEQIKIYIWHYVLLYKESSLRP
jgi:hypothetical protein